MALTNQHSGVLNTRRKDNGSFTGGERTRIPRELGIMVYVPYGTIEPKLSEPCI